MSSVLSWSFIVYSVNGRLGNTPSSLMEKSQDFGVFFNLKWVFEDICIASTLTNCYGYMYVYYRAGSIIAQSKHNVMYLSCSWHLTTKQPFFHDFFSVWAFEKGNNLFIRLLNNKFHGLSPSCGHHSLFFDQGLPTTAPSSRSEAIWQDFVSMRLYLEVPPS